MLVAAGLGLAVTGFVRNGRSEGNTLGPALLFLLGVIALTFGILLTNVPDFFSGQ